MNNFDKEFDESIKKVTEEAENFDKKNKLLKEVTFLLAEIVQEHGSQLTKFRRILIASAILILCVFSGLGWKLVEHDYKVAVISVIVGLLLPVVCKQIYKGW
jgi:hypothetical protein